MNTLNSSADRADERVEESKPLKKRGNAIFRQELKSLTPKCDLKCALFCKFFLMITFLAFGIPIIIEANSVVQYKEEYTDCIPDNDNFCEFNMVINERIKSPVYIYYEIHNFYMNHRDFVKSRIYPQLKGELNVDSTDNSNCEGARFVHEIFDRNESRYYSWDNQPLKGNDFANPCGLIAKNYFNDRNFTLGTADKENIFINETNIANDYDKKYMFKRIKNSRKIQWVDVEDGKS